MFKLKQFIPSRICLKCDICCRFHSQESTWSPSLLDQEIKEFLKNNIPPALISPGCKIRLMPHTKQDNFICSFFQPEDRKCKIYSLRPFECQLYPFLINSKEKKIFLAVDLECPFVKEKLKSKKFNAYVQYLTKFLHRADLMKTLKHNPQIIQAYPRVLNLTKLNPNL